MGKKLRIAIVGSRRRLDKEKVELLVNELPENTIVISGGCDGVDTWAVDAAKKRGLEYIEYEPKKLDSNASYFEVVQTYYDRNFLIAEDAIDGVFAFPSSDRKGGTENTLKHAKKLKRKIVLF